MKMTVVGARGRDDAPAHVWWTLSRQDGKTLVTVVGDLDLVSADPFAAALVAIKDERSDVIVDMAGVEFMDTAAAAAFLGVHRAFADLGNVLIVRSPSRAVRRILSLCRHDDLVEHAEGAVVTPMFRSGLQEPSGWGPPDLFTA